MNIVLDVNIFISSIFWYGPPHSIIQLAEQGKLKIYATSAIITELFGVLYRKKFDYLFREGSVSREDIFFKLSRLVYLCQTSEEIKEIVDDPRDDKFLACALACQADFIVSGDSHLLKLKEFQGISILTPKEFLEHFKK